MQTITRAAGRNRLKSRSPLGSVIASLLAGRGSAAAVFDRYLEGTTIGRRLYKAIRHGSLVDGRIKSSRLAPRTLEMLPPELTRTLERRSARRMLALFLVICEHIDPHTGQASGKKLWQGHGARRLGLSLTRDAWGRLGGIREVQRYVRLFDAAEVFGRSQPSADHVPEHMKARAKLCTVRGRVIECAWSYSKIWTLPGYPLPQKIRDVLRRWRGEVVRIVTSTPKAAAYDAPEVATAAEAFAWLRARGAPS